MSHGDNEGQGTPKQSGEEGMRNSPQLVSKYKIGDVSKPTVDHDQLNGYCFIDIALLRVIFQMKIGYIFEINQTMDYSMDC